MSGLEVIGKRGSLSPGWRSYPRIKGSYPRFSRLVLVFKQADENSGQRGTSLLPAVKRVPKRRKKKGFQDAGGRRPDQEGTRGRQGKQPR